MSQYAAQTTVPPQKSRAEIERTLEKYGANGFMYGWEDSGQATVGFKMRGRLVKFILPLPDREDFKLTERGRERSPATFEKAYDQAIRQRWRALALVVKAKLEAVESGIVTFDSEFLAHIVLPDGQTVGGWMQPQLELAYERAEMPKLLPAPGGAH